MPLLKIDDLELNTEDLSERGLANLKSLQFVDENIEKIRLEIALIKTARGVYATSLKEILDKHVSK